MRYYLKVYLKQLLIRLGLRRATLGMHLTAWRSIET